MRRGTEGTKPANVTHRSRYVKAVLNSRPLISVIFNDVLLAPQPCGSFIASSGVGATRATEAIHSIGATRSATEAIHGVVSASITNSASVTTNVTLYHINPLSYSAAPVDMDLGDVAGDLYFDISQVLQAFSCHGMLPKPSYCVNKETHGQDLGVTKVVLALSEQSYGPYIMCNICVNGTSPLNHSHTCTKGEYVCDCGDACTAAVGYENTTVLSAARSACFTRKDR